MWRVLIDTRSVGPSVGRREVACVNVGAVLASALRLHVSAVCMPLAASQSASRGRPKAEMLVLAETTIPKTNSNVLTISQSLNVGWLVLKPASDAAEILLHILGLILCISVKPTTVECSLLYLYSQWLESKSRMLETKNSRTAW